MGLHIRRSSSRKVQLVVALFAAFALVSQPLYSVLTSQMAAALMDPVAPTVPSRGQPHGDSSDGFKQTNEFDFTWSASSAPLGGSVTYEFQSTQNPAESGGVLTTGLWKSGSLSSAKIHSSGAGNGVWYWQVRAVDQASNKSAWSSIWHMTIDSHVPDVTIATHDLVRGTTTLAGTMTDANPDHYYFVVKDANGVVVAGPGEVDQTTIADWQWDTTKMMNDGQYTAHLEAVDKAGNKGVADKLIVVDNTRPDVQIMSPTQFSVVDDTKRVTISGTATDVTSGVATVGVRIQKANDTGVCGDEVGSFSSDVVNGDWSSQFDTSRLESGNYCVVVMATDIAGNQGADGQPDYFTVDNLAPNVTMRLMNPTTPMASTDSILLEGNIANGPASLILKTMKDGVALDNVDLTSSVDSSGNWSYEMPKEKVVQGKYTFSIVARDQYGNTNTQSMPIVEVVVGPYVPGQGSTIAPDLVSPFAPNFTTPNALTAPAPFTAAQVQIKPDTAVLGAETTKDSTAQSSDVPVVATTGGWKIFGTAWYWWMLIITMILAGVWWTVASVRRRTGQVA